MKISNFELIETRKQGLAGKMYIAEVDVKRLFKKIERVRVCRETCGFWYWEDSGKFTPTFKIEKLARSYKAKTGKEC